MKKLASQPIDGASAAGSGRVSMEGPALEEPPVQGEHPRCTRCGRIPRRTYDFRTDVTSRNAVLCPECRAEWDCLLEDVAGRWLRGLAVCFFCRRPLGDERFPASSGRRPPSRRGCPGSSAPYGRPPDLAPHDRGEPELLRRSGGSSISNDPGP
jgi:hypothetical protein